jgi:glycerophosphoryl diester phosphodiesterase
VKLLYISTILCLSLTASAVAQVAPRPAAHAHNDYLHARPLQDALDQGFCSVEADIFLIGGQLLVAHTRLEVTKDRTLQSLYLEPLKQRVAANDGKVFRDGPTFGLLIDIKSDAESTYLALHEVLAGYPDLFTRVDNGQVKPGPVQVVISGNRPQELIASQPTRYCGIDGRLGDLDSNQPAHLLPMISDNWTSHFKWRGKGNMPAEERQKLQDIVQRAHAKGRVVRFWATPEEPELWKELKAAKVDRINTDKLAELSAYLAN